MISATEHYFFPQSPHCRWPLEPYTYRGLCSHFSLKEFNANDKETQAQRYVEAEQKVQQKVEKEAKRKEREIESAKKEVEKEAKRKEREEKSAERRAALQRSSSRVEKSKGKTPGPRQRAKYHETVVQQYGACLGNFTSKSFTS